MNITPNQQHFLQTSTAPSNLPKIHPITEMSIEGTVSVENLNRQGNDGNSSKIRMVDRNRSGGGYKKERPVSEVMNTTQSNWDLSPRRGSGTGFRSDKKMSFANSFRWVGVAQMTYEELHLSDIKYFYGSLSLWSTFFLPLATSLINQPKTINTLAPVIYPIMTQQMLFVSEYKLFKMRLTTVWTELREVGVMSSLMYGHHVMSKCQPDDWTLSPLINGKRKDVNIENFNNTVNEINLLINKMLVSWGQHFLCALRFRRILTNGYK